MGIIGVSITKRVSYRESTQEFSNVYFYEITPVPTNAAAADPIIDEVKAYEVPLHSTEVTFVRGRLWTAGGSPAANEMISQKNLSGTGNQAPNSSLDRERAVLAYWPAGVDSRGKPVFLRKWYHSCGGCAGVAFVAGEMQQTVSLTSTKRDQIAAAVNDVEIIQGGAGTLRAESGRQRTGNILIHKFLEHHQLGDQWRAQ